MSTWENVYDVKLGLELSAEEEQDMRPSEGARGRRQSDRVQLLETLNKGATA